MCSFSFSVVFVFLVDFSSILFAVCLRSGIIFVSYMGFVTATHKKSVHQSFRSAEDQSSECTEDGAASSCFVKKNAPQEPRRVVTRQQTKTRHGAAAIGCPRAVHAGRRPRSPVPEQLFGQGRVCLPTVPLRGRRARTRVQCRWWRHGSVSSVLKRDCLLWF